MAAYYNEHDPFAAAWLRKLIAADLIADGEVDERSIEQVEPSDLRGFTQCHFFAGIGVWSYALRRAGWSDAARVWTGSCPCQSFSASGKREGFSDKRHLWPAWFRLIRECRPDVCFGEQVASNDGLTWFDVVSSDMEGEGYTIGAADLCAAGYGAPHIRQRLYFVADSECSGREHVESSERAGVFTPFYATRESRLQSSAYGSGVRAVAESSSEQDNPTTESGLHSDVSSGSADGVVANAENANGRRTGNQRNKRRGATEVGGSSFVGELGHAETNGRERQPLRTNGKPQDRVTQTGITSGFWANAEWLYCRDKKYRPVEPGTFPLAHGATNRSGTIARLR